MNLEHMTSANISFKLNVHLNLRNAIQDTAEIHISQCSKFIFFSFFFNISFSSRKQHLLTSDHSYALNKLLTEVDIDIQIKEFKIYKNAEKENFVVNLNSK